jgi:hypothetical protein
MQAKRRIERESRRSERCTARRVGAMMRQLDKLLAMMLKVFAVVPLNDRGRRHVYARNESHLPCDCRQPPRPGEPRRAASHTGNRRHHCAGAVRVH